MEGSDQRYVGAGMIPIDYILAWTKVVPWRSFEQVEQDLIITAALVKIYSHPVLNKSLAFRGGTALNKLVFNPGSRYSEDIDLVQITGEPIGPTLSVLRAVMDPWLGKATCDRSRGGVTLNYKMSSDAGASLKLKIEINTREHLAVMGFREQPFSNTSLWHPGDAVIRTYCTEELLGTKLRALYQRRKGRDLYDLYKALTTLELDADAIVRCFHEYMRQADHHITRQLFIDCMELKLQNKEFRIDMQPLLPHHETTTFDPDIAYEYIRKHLLERL